MTPKPLNLIVACAENRVIGRDGRLPWSIPEDWAFFKRQTAGQVLIIGRRSFETWRSAARAGDHVRTAPTFTEALALADRVAMASGCEIYVCGGVRIYAEALALAGRRPLRLMLTLVQGQPAGDTHMPEWRHLDWREVSRRESADANWRYTFVTLELGGGG